MTKTIEIVQICRRFGPVGGMERYVWELCRELAAMGHQVHVLCEANRCTEVLKGVHIHELGIVRPRPRWLAHMRFSHRVHTWLEQYRTPKMIIHSHERTQDHHITTFHGPPFAQVKERPLWKRISLRISINLWLEQKELCAPQVQMIVPNSKRTRQQLEIYYPTVHNKLSEAIVPGVGDIAKRMPRDIPAQGGVIGFIGKEWKRKGLTMAINILSELATVRPHLHFLVAGCDKKEAAQLFKHCPFQYTLLGRVEPRNFYQQLDILLHPAQNEPFGMVITEAMTAGVPVIISDACGAASEVTAQLGYVLSLDESHATWVSVIELSLQQGAHQHVYYQRKWHDFALMYNRLYQSIYKTL